MVLRARTEFLDFTAKTTLYYGKSDFYCAIITFSSKNHFFTISWKFGGERWYLERKLIFSISRQKWLDITAKTIWPWYYYFFHLKSMFSKSPGKLVAKDGTESANWFSRFYGKTDSISRQKRFWPWYYYFFHLKSIFPKSPGKLVAKDGT